MLKESFDEFVDGKRHEFTSFATIVNAPPAERVASGSPLEGGEHVGKAPKGLL
jgi:hypothetical protein